MERTKMTNPTNHNRWRVGEPEAMNIVHQIGDLLYENLPPDIAHEYFVKARQNTNDRAIDFTEKIISSLLEASHKEIIGKLEGKKIPLWQDEDVKGFNYGLDTSIRIIKDLSKLK